MSSKKLGCNSSHTAMWSATKAMKSASGNPLSPDADALPRVLQVRGRADPPCGTGLKRRGHGMAHRPLPLVPAMCTTLRPFCGCAEGGTEGMGLLQIDAVAHRPRPLEHRQLGIEPIEDLCVLHALQECRRVWAIRIRLASQRPCHSSLKLNWIQPMRVGLMAWLSKVAVRPPPWRAEPVGCWTPC